MEKEITIRFMEDEDGYFIGKADGYPGVISYGRSKEAMMDGIREAWFAVDEFNSIRNLSASSNSANKGPKKQATLRLQLAD